MTDRARNVFTVVNTFMVFFWLFLQAFCVKDVIQMQGYGREKIFIASIMVIIHAFSVGVDFAIAMARKGYVKGLKADDVEDSNETGNP